jgi:hypothetical protein
MQSCRPVYIPVSRSPLLGLLGLGLGCPTPVMANGAEMKARGLAAVHGLLLILVAPFSAFPFLCFFLLPYRSWLPAAVAPLFRQISGRQACSDVFGVGAARLVCFPYLGFGSSVAVSGNGGMRLLSPCFCERKGFIDGIPNGGVGGGWWWFRLLAAQSTAVDPCSSPYLLRTVADGCSSSKLRLGVGPGCQFLRLHQCLTSLEEVGGGVQFAVTFRRRAGTPVMSLEVLAVISKVVRVLFVKWGMYCANF